MACVQCIIILGLAMLAGAKMPLYWFLLLNLLHGILGAAGIRACTQRGKQKLGECLLMLHLSSHCAPSANIRKREWFGNWKLACMDPGSSFFSGSSFSLPRSKPLYCFVPVLLYQLDLYMPWHRSLSANEMPQLKDSMTSMKLLT